MTTIQNKSLDCDILIVGSGAGGSIIASVLTQAGLDVLMVEEGPYIDAKHAPKYADEGIRKLWRNSGLTVALGKTPIAYAEGLCVGGGTEINSAIFQRTPDELIEEWARKYKIKEFTPSILAPYYDRVAKILNASLTPPPLGEASDILKRAGNRMGWKVIELERSQRGCVSTNRCASTCPTGAKQTMTSTLIPRAITKGMRLISNCKIFKLISKDKVILGAQAIHKDKNQTYKIHIKAKSVFLCGGAISTPTILQRSGIKTKAPYVLRMHPTIKMLCLFDHEINAHLSQLPLYAITEFMPDIRLGGSLFGPGYFGMSVAEDWEQRQHLLPQWKNCAIYYAMIRGKGKGKIFSIPFLNNPIVTYNLDAEDWNNLNFGITKLGQAMITAGAKKVYPSISHHSGWGSVKECNEFSDTGLPHNKTNLMTIHLFSSCPPGENQDLCVTDSFGRLSAMSNLFIADASQIPEAPGVNPQATIMALAYRIAENFLLNNHSTYNILANKE